MAPNGASAGTSREWNEGMTALRITRVRPLQSATAGLALILAGALLIAPRVDAAPGDVFVYRVINAYNRETVGHVRHESAAAPAAQGEVLEVTVDHRALGVDRTEMILPGGQWLRRPLDNHGIPVEYDFFSGALPVVQAPLAPGQSWSARVPARVAGETRSRSVRVDGRVLAAERIRVPAGEFDTLKIDRVIYAGDSDYFISETRIYEIDWYAPALGRSVRTETRSSWSDTRSGCRRPEHCIFRGNWHLYELIEVRTATH